MLWDYRIYPGSLSGIVSDVHNVIESIYYQLYLSVNLTDKRHRNEMETTTKWPVITIIIVTCTYNCAGKQNRAQPRSCALQSMFECLNIVIMYAYISTVFRMRDKPERRRLLYSPGCSDEKDMVIKITVDGDRRMVTRQSE